LYWELLLWHWPLDRAKPVNALPIARTPPIRSLRLASSFPQTPCRAPHRYPFRHTLCRLYIIWYTLPLSTTQKNHINPFFPRRRQENNTSLSFFTFPNTKPASSIASPKLHSDAPKTLKAPGFGYFIDFHNT